MEKCKIISTRYVESESITFQGDWKKAQKYRDKGYNVNDLGKGDGNWIATKPSQAIVKVSNSLATETFNMRRDILEYYGKIKLTEKLVKKFENDTDDGKITIKMDTDSNYEIK